MTKGCAQQLSIIKRYQGYATVFFAAVDRSATEPGIREGEIEMQAADKPPAVKKQACVAEETKQRKAVKP